MPKTIKIGNNTYEVTRDPYNADSEQITVGDSEIWLEDLQYLTGLTYTETPSDLDQLPQGLYVVVNPWEPKPVKLIGYGIESVYYKDDDNTWWQNEDYGLEGYEVSDLEEALDEGNLYALAIGRNAKEIRGLV